MDTGKVSGDNHTLIAFFEHARTIEEKTESREVGENRVRKSYGRDGIELPDEVNRLATGVIRDYGLTRGSLFLYQLMSRETSTTTPARNDARPLKRDSSPMLDSGSVRKTFAWWRAPFL
jgi:hypothetical protein